MSEIKPTSLQMPQAALPATTKAKDASEAELKKVTGAAEQFESLLLHQMFSSMWQGLGKDNLFGDGREMEYFRDFYNKALADSVSSGQGIGIKEVIVREMTKKDKPL